MTEPAPPEAPGVSIFLTVACAFAGLADLQAFSFAFSRENRQRFAATPWVMPVGAAVALLQIACLVPALARPEGGPVRIRRPGAGPGGGPRPGGGGLGAVFAGPLGPGGGGRGLELGTAPLAHGRASGQAQIGSTTTALP